MTIWNAQRRSGDAEILCPSRVVGVRLVRDRIYIVLKSEVRIYRLKKTEELIDRFETVDNPHGLIAVADNAYAYPGRMPGHVRVYRTDSLGVGESRFVTAHSSALSALAISQDGELLATASEQGTLIRIWSTRSGAKLTELRRGHDPATIFSLAFSPAGRLLACTSDKGTLHVFDVSEPPESEDGDASSMGSALSLISPTVVPPANPGKWGLLGKLPFMPNYFRDAVSFAHAPFHMGASEERVRRIEAAHSTAIGLPHLPRGIIGWAGEDMLAVVGAGVNPRYERFVIHMDQDGKRSLTLAESVAYLER